MAEVWRDADGPALRLEPVEIALLRQLLDGLDELVGGDAASAAGASSDPLALLVGFDPPSAPAEPDAENSVSDPALRRLFPDGYRADPSASAEYRRYTEGSLRDGLRADAGVLRIALVTAEPGNAIEPRGEALQAWLRSLTSLRLVLAVRLGIEGAADQDALERAAADDPRTPTFELYCWLGLLLEGLLDAVG